MKDQRAIITILLLVLGFTAFSQKPNQDILDLFGEQKIGVWVKHYQGTSDDLSNVILSLGHNEKVYKGFMRHAQNSKKVEGVYHKDSLKLLTINSIDEADGFIEGTIQDSSIQAVHFDLNHSNARVWNLSRTRKPSVDETCGADMKLIVLEGTILKDNAQIILQKEESGIVEGLIHFENQGVSYDLEGQCKDANCTYAELSLLNEKGTSLGTVGLDMRDNNYTISLSSSTQKNQNTSLSFVRDYSIVCRTFIINNIRINYTYPETESEKFNSWIKKEMIAWVTNLNLSLDANDRREWGDYRSWVDIDFLNNKIISGTITHAIKDHPGHERKSFIFPLKSNSPTPFKTWVRDDEENDKFINELIAAQRKHLTNSQSILYNNWLLQQDFKYQSLRREGLCLKTDFNSIYGEQRIVIPWALLKPFLKRNNVFTKYISQ